MMNSEIKGYVICNPHIPKSMQDALRVYGWQPVAVPYCTTVHPSLQGHVDLQLFVIDDDEVVVYKNMPKGFIDFLLTIFKRVSVGENTLNAEYPLDIPYNACRVGDSFFHRLDCTDSVLLERVANAGYNTVHTAQGYTGCSVLVIADNAIITADKHIADQAQRNGYDVLLINAGSIHLQGMNYGFIGGCGGWDGGQTIYFCGSLETHPQKKEISAFVKKYGRGIVNLSNTTLTDYGSLVFVRHKKPSFPPQNKHK